MSRPPRGLLVPLIAADQWFGWLPLFGSSFPKPPPDYRHYHGSSRLSRGDENTGEPPVFSVVGCSAALSHWLPLSFRRDEPADLARVCRHCEWDWEVGARIRPTQCLSMFKKTHNKTSKSLDSNHQP